MVAGREIFSSPHVAPEKRMGLSFAAPHAGRDHAVALGEQVVIISIHAPLAGRDPEPRFGYKNDRISIHAPLAGCDFSGDDSSGSSSDFNPRTPCGVRRHHRRDGRPDRQFQSTHPLRGATMLPSAFVSASEAISIHAPLAGCDFVIPTRLPGMNISIHAPLAGCDCYSCSHNLVNVIFQSTHPLRGATLSYGVTATTALISIHAPLAGCDVTFWDTVRGP